MKRSVILNLKHDLEGQYNALAAHRIDATSLKNLITIINNLNNVVDLNNLPLNVLHFLTGAINITYLNPLNANTVAQNLINNNLDIAYEYQEINHAPENNWFMTALNVFFSCLTRSSETICPEQDFIYRTTTDEMTFGGKTHSFGEKKYHFEDPKDFDTA